MELTPRLNSRHQVAHDVWSFCSRLMNTEDTVYAETAQNDVRELVRVIDAHAFTDLGRSALRLDALDIRARLITMDAATPPHQVKDVCRAVLSLACIKYVHETQYETLRESSGRLLLVLRTVHERMDEPREAFNEIVLPNLTLIGLACLRDDLKLLRYLVEIEFMHLEVNKPDYLPPILLLAKHGGVDAFDIIMEYNADVLATDALGSNMLMYAMEGNNAEVVELMRTEGWLPQANEATKTPSQRRVAYLSVAALYCGRDVFRTIIHQYMPQKSIQDPDYRESMCRTLVEVTTSSVDCRGKLEVILRHGYFGEDYHTAAPLLPMREHYRALRNCVITGDAGSLQLLLEFFGPLFCHLSHPGKDGGSSSSSIRPGAHPTVYNVTLGDYLRRGDLDKEDVLETLIEYSQSYTMVYQAKDVQRLTGVKPQHYSRTLLTERAAKPTQPQLLRALDRMVEYYPNWQPDWSLPLALIEHGYAELAEVLTRRSAFHEMLANDYTLQAGRYALARYTAIISRDLPAVRALQALHLAMLEPFAKRQAMQMATNNPRITQEAYASAMVQGLLARCETTDHDADLETKHNSRCHGTMARAFEFYDRRVVEVLMTGTYNAQFSLSGGSTSTGRPLHPALVGTYSAILPVGRARSAAEAHKLWGEWKRRLSHLIALGYNHDWSRVHYLSPLATMGEIMVRAEPNWFGHLEAWRTVLSNWSAWSKERDLPFADLSADVLGQIVAPLMELIPGVLEPTERLLQGIRFSQETNYGPLDRNAALDRSSLGACYALVKGVYQSIIMHTLPPRRPTERSREFPHGALEDALSDPLQAETYVRARLADQADVQEYLRLADRNSKETRWLLFAAVFALSLFQTLRELRLLERTFEPDQVWSDGNLMKLRGHIGENWRLEFDRRVFHSAVQELSSPPRRRDGDGDDLEEVTFWVPGAEPLPLMPHRRPPRDKRPRPEELITQQAEPDLLRLERVLTDYRRANQPWKSTLDSIFQKMDLNKALSSVEKHTLKVVAHAEEPSVRAYLHELQQYGLKMLTDIDRALWLRNRNLAMIVEPIEDVPMEPVAPPVPAPPGDDEGGEFEEEDEALLADMRMRSPPAIDMELVTPSPDPARTPPGYDRGQPSEARTPLTQPPPDDDDEDDDDDSEGRERPARQSVRRVLWAGSPTQPMRSDIDLDDDGESSDMDESNE